jgi:hypothetical protein
MFRGLLTSLVLASLVGAGALQPSGSAAQDPTMALRYTIRRQTGSTAAGARDSAVQTLKMTEAQIKAWVEAGGAAAVKERRLATFVRDGYVETIKRGADGKLRYAIRDSAGARSSRDRQGVLDTLKMTPAQLKAWADVPAGKAQGRMVEAEAKRIARITIRNAQGSVSSSKGESARNALRKSADDIRAWVRDDKDGKEQRAASFFGAGHVEIVWHDASGRLRYTIRNEQRSLTSGERASAVATLNMTESQARKWVEAADEQALKERRSAVFFKAGHAEAIARGALEEPPGVGP